MAYCHNCGEQIGADATACPECGAAVTDTHGGGNERQAGQATGVPMGVKLSSIVAALTGLLLVVLGGANWVYSNQVESTGVENSGEMASVIADLAMALAVLGLVGLVATYGLWKLRSWGWLVGTGYFAIHALAGLVFFADGQTGMIAYAAVIGVLLAYLWRQRELYGPSRYVPGTGMQRQPQ